MIRMNLRDAIEAAAAAAPSTGGGISTWEPGEVQVEIIETRVNRQWGAPRIGLQVQRADDGRRRWFDLYFDEANATGYKMTGLKLRALGMDPVIDKLAAQYPGDTDAQLDALAIALIGVVAVFKVTKRESNQNKPGTPEDEKKYVNYFDVLRAVTGPTPAPVSASEPSSGLSGLGGIGGGLVG